MFLEPFSNEPNPDPYPNPNPNPNPNPGATAGERPPLRKRLVSWMYDHVEHAVVLWEDKVRTLP